MRKFAIAAAFVLSSLMVSTEAKADLFGSSYIHFFDAEIQVFDEDLGDFRKVVAQFGAGPLSSEADILITSVVTTSDAEAGLDTGGGFVVDGGIGNVGPDAPAAYVGPGAGPGDNGGFTPGSIPPGASAPYAFADTVENGGGQLVNPFVGGVVTMPGNSDVEAISSGALDLEGQLAAGIATVGTGATFSFSFFTVQEQTFRIKYDLEIDLDFDYTPPPFGASGFLLAGFSATVRDSFGGLIGTDGLQRSINLGDPDLNLTLDDATTLEVTVLAGSNNFNIGRGVIMELQAGVPEPASLAIFGVLAVVGTGVVARRRRKQNLA